MGTPPHLLFYKSEHTRGSYRMPQSHISSVVHLIDIGLKDNEYYVQFVPPATFGVILNRSLNKIHLVRADGQKTILRRIPDKIYTLRGFIGLRQRHNRAFRLGDEIEDEMIRNILLTFGSFEQLRKAVADYCPCKESADTITKVWACGIFGDDTNPDGSFRIVTTNLEGYDVDRISNETKDNNEVIPNGAEPNLPDPPVSIPDHLFQNPCQPDPWFGSHDIKDIGLDSFRIPNYPPLVGKGCEQAPFLEDVNSLQELEQFTLPFAFIQSQQGFQHPFPSATFPPVFTIKGTQHDGQANLDLEYLIPDPPATKVQLPPFESNVYSMPPFDMQPPYPRFLSPPTSATTYSTAASNASTSAPQLKTKPSPNINPIQPSSPGFSSSFPLKRSLDQPLVNSRLFSEDPVYAEIRAMACMHALRTRYSPLGLS